MHLQRQSVDQVFGDINQRKCGDEPQFRCCIQREKTVHLNLADVQV